MTREQKALERLKQVAADRVLKEALKRGRALIRAQKNGAALDYMPASDVFAYEYASAVAAKSKIVIK